MRAGRGSTWHVLFALILLAGVLFTVHAISSAREVRTATGAPDQAQLELFIQLSGRPDAAKFFQDLSPKQRLTMARNIGAHKHSALPKLIGVLLTTFDSEARAELAKSLGRLAESEPIAVSKELKHAGSFQKVGVFAALESLGERAIPVVAERLLDPETRSNAVAFLAERGSPAVPALMKVLEADDAEARQAAADALSRTRAQQAVIPLLRLHAITEGDERNAYLSAIAGIGSPASQEVLLRAFSDASLPRQLKSRVALGLGRIGSAEAVKALWMAAESREPELRESAVTGLQLAADAALGRRPSDDLLWVEVLAGIRTEGANEQLSRLFASPKREIRLQALRSAKHRSGLVEELASVLKGADPSDEGDLADAAISALLTTERGRNRITDFEDGPWSGLIARRRSLDAES